MPYRAQRQNLFGNMGAPQPPNTSVDIPGILDSLTNAGTSFIQQAMLRRQAQNQLAIAADERAYQRGRDKIADEQKAQERSDRLSQEADQLALEREKERHRFIEQGGIPEQTTVTPTPAMASVGPIPTPESPIRAAMTQGLKPAFTPVGPPRAESNPLPSSTLKTTTTPESYDPRRAADYVRTTDAAAVRAQVQGELQNQRIAAQQSGREYAAQAAKDLARLKAQLAADAKKNNPIGKAMTGNMLETAAQKTADGLLDQFSGSYDDAYDFLMHTKEGKDLRDFGVAPRHLTAARSKWTRDAAGQAVRLQSSSFMSPDSAAAAVIDTRRLLGGGKKPTGTPLAPSDTAATKPPSGATQAPSSATKPAPAATPPAKPAGGRAPLSDAVKAKAKTDSAFARFLKGKGYSPKDWQ